MEKIIITFQADEQVLIKTGGIDKYASDTVSYIEAHFDLGENWSGYDQISAIWQSRYGTKRSVLDTEGVCLVPWEMLTKRSDLLVNLVGSIADGDVLTDRLTTFAIKALEIAQDVPIDADMPTPITPSEYEQFVATVAADADRAEAAKLDARESAAAANDSALLAAQSEANASASAQSASESAESASQSAEEAEQASQSVLGLTATASVDSSVGTPSVEVTVSESGDHKVMDFDFHSLKGEQGEQGIQGEKGEQGERGETGASGADGFSPIVEVYQTEDGHEVSITDAEGTQTFEVKNGTVEDIYPFLPTDTAQGEIASFTDGANNVPVVDLSVAIEPIQSGSGDPSPTNVRPISGHTGAVVMRTGINVWDEEWENGYYDTSGNFVSSANYICSKNMVRFNDDETLYLVASVPLTIRLYDENKTFLGSAPSTWRNEPIKPTTYQPKARYLHFFNAASGSLTTYNNDISINYPSTDTSYHAYQGQTYSISWATEAGTVYGGTLDVTTGLLTVTHKIKDLGDANWYAYPSQNGFSATFDDLGSNSFADGVCSHFKVLSSAVEMLTMGIAIGANNAYVYACHITDNIPSVTDGTSFKAWLSTNNVQLTYPLATPQTYQLTPTEVRTLLGDNNIWADTGASEVTYRADIQKYIDKQISAVLNA